VFHSFFFFFYSYCYNSSTPNFISFLEMKILSSKPFSHKNVYTITSVVYLFFARARTNKYGLQESTSERRKTASGPENLQRLHARTDLGDELSLWPSPRHVVYVRAFYERHYVTRVELSRE